MIPDFEGGFLEWGYGDWDWYALLRNRWYHVFDTMLWPTQGCLGKKAWSEDRIRELVRQEKLLGLIVGTREARALLEDLDGRFRAHAATLLHNELYGMDFVHDSDGFWMLHNCNDAVAAWMKRLGCRVGWTPVRLDLRLGNAPDQKDQPTEAM